MSGSKAFALIHKIVMVRTRGGGNRNEEEEKKKGGGLMQKCWDDVVDVIECGVMGEGGSDP